MTNEQEDRYRTKSAVRSWLRKLAEIGCRKPWEHIEAKLLLDIAGGNMDYFSDGELTEFKNYYDTMAVFYKLERDVMGSGDKQEKEKDGE